MAGPQRGIVRAIRCPALTPALAQQEQQQRRVIAPPGAHHFAPAHDRALLARNRAFQRAILQPGDAPVDGQLPCGGKAFRPRLVAQAIERLQRSPDPPRRLRHDPRRRQRRDEFALPVGRDRIAARLLVQIGRKAEQRIVRLWRQVGKGGAAGAFPRAGRGTEHRARFAGIVKAVGMAQGINLHQGCWFFPAGWWQTLTQAGGCRKMVLSGLRREFRS